MTIISDPEKVSMKTLRVHTVWYANEQANEQVYFFPKSKTHTTTS